MAVGMLAVGPGRRRPVGRSPARARMNHPCRRQTRVLLRCSTSPIPCRGVGKLAAATAATAASARGSHAEASTQRSTRCPTAPGGSISRLASRVTCESIPGVGLEERLLEIEGCRQLHRCSLPAVRS